MTSTVRVVVIVLGLSLWLLAEHVSIKHAWNIAYFFNQYTGTVMSVNQLDSRTCSFAPAIFICTMSGMYGPSSSGPPEGFAAVRFGDGPGGCLAGEAAEEQLLTSFNLESRTHRHT